MPVPQLTIAEAIRLATSQNRVHPLVRDNWASPRGICNCCKYLKTQVVFCQLEYAHDGEHANGQYKWAAAWPPPELHVRAVPEAIQTGRADTLQPEFICVRCGSEVYFQREQGPCPQCGDLRPGAPKDRPITVNESCSVHVLLDAIESCPAHVLLDAIENYKRNNGGYLPLSVRVRLIGLLIALRDHHVEESQSATSLDPT